MRFHTGQHLRRPLEIQAVRERGRRVDCRAFTLWWKQRDTVTGAAPVLATPRVCVIASSKAVGAAVQRNRAKRRLREVFRLHQQHVPANCDLLLIAREASAHWPLPELGRRFVEGCRQIVPVTVS
jgi:ribonuclease P protein component